MKPKNKVNKRPITSLLIGLGFLSVILLATLIAASQNTKNYNPNNVTGSENGDLDAIEGGTLLCVVKGIDLLNQRITLTDISSGEELTLSYNGGTGITDKYKKVISINQITLGIMVDVNYQKDNNKLINMSITTRAKEFKDVKKWNISLNEQVMEIASEKYRFNNNLSILDGEAFVTASSLAKQDELTIYVVDKMIYSVIITKGHGTVRLENYQDYIGKSIKIGYEPLQKIVDDMEITVKEGEWPLTVENGSYSGTKNIIVNRNQVTDVSLSDLGRIGPETGLVLFQVTPYGADLFVDGKLTTYADALELEYGNHTIKASLGGYNTYEGMIVVSGDRKTVKIKLPEETSDEDASATEGDTPTPTISPSEAPQDSENVDSNHKIYVQTPVGASVYFDGSFIGVTPCNYKKVLGSHVLTFIKEGYETQSYNINVQDDKEDSYFNYPELTKSDEKER